MKKPLLNLLEEGIETLTALMHEIPNLSRDNLFLLEATSQYLKEEKKSQVDQLANWEVNTTKTREN